MGATSDHSDASILIVDDEPQLADLYTTMLEREYDVAAVSSGQAALDVIAETTEVALVDRRMPGFSGDQLATRIEEQDLDTRVALVTAIEPTLDILQVPFDAYLVKPVAPDELRQVVTHLVDRPRYPKELRELLTVAAKLAAVESSSVVMDPTDEPAYRRLRRRRRTLLRRWRDRLGSVAEWDDSEQLYRSLLNSTTG